MIGVQQIRGMIQYVWTEEVKRKERRETAFNNHFESFIKSAFKQKKSALSAKLKQSG
jgi:hypothetical protein